MKKLAALWYRMVILHSSSFILLVDNPVLVVGYCFLGVVMHSVLRRYLQCISTSAFIHQRGGSQPGVGIFQLGIGDAFPFGELCQVGNARCDGHFRVGDGRIKMFPFQQKTVLLRIADDGFGCQQAKHVA